MDNSTPGMDEKLVSLLDGELAAEERTTFEQQLANDALLQQQFDSLLATRAAIRHYGLQQQVSAVHQLMMTEMNTPVKRISPVRKMIRYTSAVAAGILLLIGVFYAYQFFNVSPEKVFSANYQPYELSTVRGTNNNLPIEEAYRAKNYKEVLRLYVTAAPSIKSSFLAGAAALEVNDPAMAKDRFVQVIEQNKAAGSRVLLDEAEYYLSLTLVRLRKYDEALLWLGKIKADAGHTYHDKVAAGLFNDVQKLSK